jgi:hypothetical protein
MGRWPVANPVHGADWSECPWQQLVLQQMSLHSFPRVLEDRSLTHYSTTSWQCLALHYSPSDCLPEMDISNISDPLLLDYLCHGRAVFPYSCNNNNTFMVECLTSLRRVVSPYPFQLEYLIARRFAADDATPLTMLHMVLVRYCFNGANCERLKDVCTRPCWTVARDEYYAGHSFTAFDERGAAPGWKLQTGGPAGQMELAGLAQYITHCRCCALPRRGSPSSYPPSVAGGPPSSVEGGH